MPLSYKSLGRDVIYVPGFYEEKSGNAMEKKAEMAAHMAAREDSVAPLPSPAMSEKKAEAIGKNNNDSLMELNVGINDGERYVAEKFQMDPRFMEDLMHNHNCALVSQLVLVQNSCISSPDKETLEEGNGNPIITEIRASTIRNAILSYFSIPKNYFINYTIQFYNTFSIPTFIFLFYSLK